MLGGPQYQMGMPMGVPQYQMGMPMGGPQYQMGMAMPPVNPFPLPTGIPGIPPGLEYLNVIDTVFVRQRIEALEIIAGVHTPNKYDLFNVHGELLFRAIEVTDPLHTMYLGDSRNFNIMLFDVWGRQVISLNRPWSGCSQQPLTVYAPPGNIVGIVDPQSCCDSEFLVRDAAGQPGCRIQGLGGMCCVCTTCGTVDFKVMNLQGSEMGNITKQYAGYFQEMRTAADNFVITFPKDLNISAKATLVGACVLLDFTYFENVGTRDHDRHRRPFSSF